MKNIVLSIAIAVVSLVAFSCSKSDDNTQNTGDEIFDAPYTPLANLNEIGKGPWKYQGAKIGAKKVGLISKTNCLSNNKLFFYENDINGKMDSIFFENYEGLEISQKDCVLDYKRVMRDIKLKSVGKIYVDIYDNTIKRDTNPDTNEIEIEIIRKTHFVGDFEIGFQKDMLRIEDKISRYNGNEKVYLYFRRGN